MLSTRALAPSLLLATFVLAGCPMEPPPKAGPMVNVMGSRPAPPCPGCVEARAAGYMRIDHNNLGSAYYNDRGAIGPEGALRIGLSDDVALELGGGYAFGDELGSGSAALRFRAYDNHVVDLNLIVGGGVGASEAGWDGRKLVGGGQLGLELGFVATDWCTLYVGSRYQLTAGEHLQMTHHGQHTAGVELAFWRMFIAGELSVVHFHTHDSAGLHPAYAGAGGQMALSLGFR